MITAIEKGKIKAAYVIGDDPRLKGRLYKLQFLAVQTMFLSSVAQDADVVLPSAALTEKQGTVTGGDRVTRKVNKAVEPRGESKPDWWITCQIGKRMGGEGFPYRSAAGIPSEIKKTVMTAGENTCTASVGESFAPHS